MIRVFGMFLILMVALNAVVDATAIRFDHLVLPFRIQQEFCPIGLVLAIANSRRQSYLNLDHLSQFLSLWC